MSVKIDVLPDEPIILFTVKAPLRAADDARLTSEKSLQFAEECCQPVYRVVDFRSVNLSFTDVVMAMVPGVSVPEELVHTYMVGSDEMVKFAAESARQDQYGNLPVHVFASVDEALAEIRRERVI